MWAKPLIRVTLLCKVALSQCHLHSEKKKHSIHHIKTRFVKIIWFLLWFRRYLVVELLSSLPLNQLSHLRCRTNWVYLVLPTCTDQFQDDQLLLVYCKGRYKNTFRGKYIISWLQAKYSLAHRTPPTSSFTINLQVRFQIETLNVLTFVPPSR